MFKRFFSFLILFIFTAQVQAQVTNTGNTAPTQKEAMKALSLVGITYKDLGDGTHELNLEKAGFLSKYKNIGSVTTNEDSLVITVDHYGENPSFPVHTTEIVLDENNLENTVEVVGNELLFSQALLGEGEVVEAGMKWYHIVGLIGFVASMFIGQYGPKGFERNKGPSTKFIMGAVGFILGLIIFMGAVLMGILEMADEACNNGNGCRVKGHKH